MKKVLLTLVIFISYSLGAQLAGKKVKTPFKAVDGHTYSVGDKITVGYPSAGNHFENIFFYKFESGFETVSKILDTATGGKPDSSTISYAPQDVKDTSGNILYFKELKGATYAIIPYKSIYQLAIAINLALPAREMISGNPEYLKTAVDKAANTANAEAPSFKNFSLNFNTKFLSAEGDSDRQTVTLTFLISHPLVHQDVCFNGDDESKAYDFDGNEYKSKEVSVGNAGRTGIFGNYSCNKVPTNVPVKATVKFPMILPSVKKLNYVEIKVGYKAFESTAEHQYGNIELKNVDIHWK